MLAHLVARARTEGVLDRMVAVHAGLGVIEWPATRELAERQARALGVPALRLCDANATGGSRPTRREAASRPSRCSDAAELPEVIRERYDEPDDPYARGRRAGQRLGGFAPSHRPPCAAADRRPRAVLRILHRLVHVQDVEAVLAALEDHADKAVEARCRKWDER